MTDMRDPRETEELEFSDDDATPPSDEGEARRFTVPAGTKKMRLDAFLGSAAELSRSRAEMCISGMLDLSFL